MQFSEQNHIQLEYYKQIKSKKVKIYLLNKKVLHGVVKDSDLYTILFQPISDQDNSLRLETNLIYKSSIASISIDEIISIKEYFSVNNTDTNNNQNNKSQNVIPKKQPKKKQDIKKENINQIKKLDNDNKNTPAIPSIPDIQKIPFLSEIKTEENKTDKQDVIISKDKFDYHEKETKEEDKNKKTYDIKDFLKDIDIENK